MNRITLGIIAFFLLCNTAFATTYYASPSGGGAASCVDNGANVCTLQRAIVVAAAGTNTIEMANGTYACTTSCNFDATNTGANLTLQPANGATVTVGSSGVSYVFDIQPAMVSGTITFDNVGITDADTDYGVANRAPEVAVIYKNGTISETDATQGVGFRYALDTTNKIALESGEDTVMNLHTGATTNTRIAQKIVPAANITVNRASLKLRRRCGNIGTNCNQFVSGESWDYRTGEVLTLTIETDTAGAPSGTPVANGTAVTKLAYNVPYESFEHEIFTFASNVSLTSGTTYWVVLKDNYTASASNFIEAAVDTGNGYAGGDAATYDGTTWTGSAAGTDLIFGIDRAHTRTLEVYNSTITSRGANFFLAWADTINIHNNTLTSTAGGILGLTGNNDWTTVDDHYKKVLFVDNVVNSTTNLAQMLSSGTNTFARTYLNLLVVKGNSGVVNIVMQPRYYVRELFFYGNNLEVQYAGNCPFQLGKEVDGVDPQDLIPQRFNQIVIENNTFYYSATAHNHIFLFAMGAENGVFKNNTVRAPNGSGASGGGWGMILKASNWKILGNRFAGPGPAIYVTNNYTTIVGNTFESYDATGSNSALLFRAHQDNIYGGDHGIPKYSFIEDNIFISHGAFAALTYCDNANCSTGSPSTLGLYRTEPYWSNRLDNNIYYSVDNGATAAVQIGSGTSLENVTTAEGLSTLRATWASSTYTDKGSMAAYNDLQNSYIGSIIGIDGYNNDFTTGDSHAVGKGTVSGTNIGADQVSGSGGSGSSKMGISL